MTAPDTQAYIAVMEEIKRRTSVIHALLRNDITVVYPATHIESMVLQLRMIIELIALASVAANRKLFEEQKKKFEKHWHPGKILKDVEHLNPNFYPRPIKEVPSNSDGVVNDLIDIKSGFLTRDQLIALHGRCGDLLHAKNPFGKGVDYGLYERMVPQWLEQIRVLLNCHQIRLLDNEYFYLVHMKEERDNNVHMYTFRRADDY
ncbi:hypothetical protein [Methylophaga sp.]|uniref:hypothetical protein n=1 Tax=Methylophaga sp. TaxID=2024840 RepID=UPI0025D39B42|nr:hypothetical protein [Methylophaga sp.]